MRMDEALAERIHDVLDGRDGITSRRMFGGLAFLSFGRMFCGIVQDDLMVRVGPEQYERALAQPHVRVMDFTGRPLAGYVYVDYPGLGSEAELRRWVELGHAFVQTLPKKKVAQPKTAAAKKRR
jgi:TfoX/Sxy family transcriptional regulator of competence genes